MVLGADLRIGGCDFSRNIPISLPPGFARRVRFLLLFALLLFLTNVVRADTVGSISGTVTDPSGAVIPDTTVTALNLDTTVLQTTRTNANGFYNFTALPVGRYEIEILREGFQPYKRTGLVIDVNSQLRADVSLAMGTQSEEVVVSDTSVHVETESTQMGDVETGQVITAVALNGRSFTDLLSLQPSIVPMSTQTNDSVVMAGVTVAITPSGNLNAGNQSINGQREDANGFLVNGSDVKELMNGGTAIIPDLDSISEFRVLTNNFDPEYGNYAGGIVNVVTQGGGAQFHGDVFEFLRNTVLDAKSYFATQTDTFQQNQFGGTLGGPIRKNKLFFFGDYQGTRTVEGLETGLVNVPTAAEQQGDFADTGLPGVVQGAGLAAQLQNSLHYAVPVFSGEPYFTPGCTSATCVFPNAVIPKAAWAAPAQNLLQYIPLPNDGQSTFSGTADERLRDDKASFRVDANSVRWGNFSAYYFFLTTITWTTRFRAGKVARPFPVLMASIPAVRS